MRKNKSMQLFLHHYKESRSMYSWRTYFFIKTCKDVHKRVYAFLTAIYKVCISVFKPFWTILKISIHASGRLCQFRWKSRCVNCVIKKNLQKKVSLWKKKKNKSQKTISSHSTPACRCFSQLTVHGLFEKYATPTVLLQAVS